MKYYQNNQSLKSANQAIEFTPEQIREIILCKDDPIYFIEKYCKIVSLDKGIILFKLYPYQKRIIQAIHNNSKIIIRLGRQLGKTQCVSAYIVYYITFFDNKSAALLANKQKIAAEVFSRVQFTLEQLPDWLKQGVLEYNKLSMTLENGSKCIAAASSPSAIRGNTISMCVCDEFAHMKNNLAEEFIKSVFPTISSSKSGKIVLISTPNGLNHFFKIYNDAEKGLNDFVIVNGTWQENPDRDQDWCDEQLRTLGKVGFEQEVNCSFVGSSYTLIDGAKLSTIPYSVPIFEKDNLEIFENPLIKHSYVITVDTSRGVHHDYSAFIVFDITSMPYKVVATFKDNAISTLEIPHLIYNIARQYNDAYLLIETNDLGQQVSDILWNDYEYTQIYFSDSTGLTEMRGVPGVRTTIKVKTIGCSILKDLIEKDQLVLSSYRIIEELGVFVLQKKSYGTSNPIINDDLCTASWLFAWLTSQSEFQALTNNDLRKKLTEQKQRYIDDMMTPFGFFDDGSSSQVEPFDPNKSFKHNGNLSHDQLGLLA